MNKYAKADDSVCVSQWESMEISVQARLAEINLAARGEGVPVRETIASLHAEIEDLTEKFLAAGGHIQQCKPYLPKGRGHQTIECHNYRGGYTPEAGDRTGMKMMPTGVASSNAGFFQVDEDAGEESEEEDELNF